MTLENNRLLLKMGGVERAKTKKKNKKPCKNSDCCDLARSLRLNQHASTTERGRIRSPHPLQKFFAFKFNSKLVIRFQLTKQVVSWATEKASERGNMLSKSASRTPPPFLTPPPMPAPSKKRQNRYVLKGIGQKFRSRTRTSTCAIASKRPKTRVDHTNCMSRIHAPKPL